MIPPKNISPWQANDNNSKHFFSQRSNGNSMTSTSFYLQIKRLKLWMTCWKFLLGMMLRWQSIRLCCRRSRTVLGGLFFACRPYFWRESVVKGLSTRYLYSINTHNGIIHVNVTCNNM